MHVCVVDAQWLTREHINLPCDPGRFLKLKAKAISILSARLGRTVYWMLKRKESFDEPRFLK